MRPHLVAPKLVAALAFLAALLPRPASAQSITTDGTVGPAQTLVGPKYIIPSSLGKQVGGNLFQSFSKFGLLAGESATFTGSEGSAIANIIGRVTGGSPSSIDGAIISAIRGASLFLINPFGIVFGAGAKVNVSGSFHASTADYLKMSDGSIFSARLANGSTFSAAPPAAFGFLSASPPAIAVEGSTLGAVPGTLGLVGGPVTITGATLFADGTIHIASAAGPGEIPVNPLTGPGATVTSYGPVSITQNAFVSVASGGSVVIRAGTLLVDASIISAENSGSGPGGTIQLQADGTITISNNASVFAPSTGAGAAGTVTVTAGGLSLTNGANISSAAFGPGTAGEIMIAATGQVTIDGGGFIAAAAGPNSSGNGGNITVTAGTLSLANGGDISSDTLGGGNGGIISISARTLSLANGSDISSDTLGSGNGGIITVAAGSISILDNGLISSGTFGVGKGGSVSVSASGLLSIDGAGAVGFTGITTGAFPGGGGAGLGPGGSVSVVAGELSLAAGGQISANSLGSRGGDVAVAVSGQLTIDGANSPAFMGVPALTGITVFGFGNGDAGQITVSAGNLTMSGGATISAGASFANGGNITINVRDLMYLIDSTITTQVGSAGLAGTGNGGNITIDPRLLVLQRSDIIATAFGSGVNGNIFISKFAIFESIDSQVIATGLVTFTNPPAELGGSLIVLSDALYSAEAILRSSCAASRGLPESSFVVGGRGGLPQDPEAELPALYIAAHAPAHGPGAPDGTAPSALRHTAIRLDMHCG
ncbi:MAG TPA: filamentous hemagglutinin N-terminal domain-containing protein [Stellaceae bacterium]|nr:filamentous hemagglutinin N-terminal domain-containing protein [Stellaceae bacterium]